MRSSLTVLILDENNFYAAGLRRVIEQFFHWRGVKLQFIHNIRGLESPDLVFFSSEMVAAQLFECLPRGKMAVNYFYIREKDKSLLGRAYLVAPGVHTIRRHATVREVVSQLGQLDQHRPRLSNVFSNKRLTAREEEILRFIALGISGCQISRILGISEKTVSTHKRNAMNRLDLTSNQLLYRWLNGTGQGHL